MIAKLPTELQAAFPPQARRALVSFLEARRKHVVDSMVSATDMETIKRFQGRANELDALIKIISQEK